ncbi:MAG: 4Fe-4S dicluster domain-containing protein, partial [Desulfuromonadaceae bacterium]|nr:4Fe-4S dicluster domain-containing protein [Desulfuromonadaceae bacterium]
VERTAVGLEPACVQTCLARARIYGDLGDKKSEIAGYVARGAVRLESSKVKIGPNVRYYGKKRDISLLTQSSAPEKIAQVNYRRIFMARMLRPSLQQVNGTSLMGLLGSIATEKDDSV